MNGEYPESERLIFGPYDRGDGQPTYGDPLALYRRLSSALDGEPNTWLRKLKSESEQERFDALDRIVPAALEVFGLVPFDPATGQGAQEIDCVNVFKAFNRWLADQ